ncbi:MAG: uncharacterized protein HW416_3230, partial [Chloroflexi bacterium]|nr:uncharacterized protein [Chloroflexota bacterium]
MTLALSALAPVLASRGPLDEQPSSDRDAPNETRSASAQGPDSLSGNDSDFVSRPVARAPSPDYGMNIFIWDSPQSTERDLNKLVAAGFGWQKSLFQWRLIEPQPGRFVWTEADRVVKASNAAGVSVIARLDFQPGWARADRAHNGPPDNYSDFGDFVYAFVDRYKRGSPHGEVAAIELWNEPNLAREWGNRPIEMAQSVEYVRLLCIGHRAAKRASADVITITGGLSPTGTFDAGAVDDTIYLQWMYETFDAGAVDDTIYLQWMYDAGAKPCFDVLGAHGAGYKAPPWVGPDQLASNKLYGGHQAFGFRRVEQLREIMVNNGDAGKQVWLLEFGWTSDQVHDDYAWHRVTEAEKA